MSRSTLTLTREAAVRGQCCEEMTEADGDVSSPEGCYVIRCGFSDRYRWVVVLNNELQLKSARMLSAALRCPWVRWRNGYWVNLHTILPFMSTFLHIALTSSCPRPTTEILPRSHTEATSCRLSRVSHSAGSLLYLCTRASTSPLPT